MRIHYTTFKIIIFSLCFYLLFQQLNAQKKTEIDPLLNTGDLYQTTDKKFVLKHFQSILLSNPDNAEVQFMTGKCFEESAQKDSAASHYLKAYQVNPKISPDILYRLGRAYHLRADFNEAIKYYKKYKRELTIENATKIKSSLREEYIRTEKRILECENGKIHYQNAFEHKITNLKEKINTEFPDYTPLISADNKILIFNSKRPGGIGNGKDKDNEYFEDIWYSAKSGNEWKLAINIGEPINSESHDACIALSPNGKELFMYRTINGGDIYVSNLDYNGTWTKPVSLSKSINSKYKEASVSISNNGKTLYFSSTGQNNIGGYDIFSTKYDAKKKTWSLPVNLGCPINSPDDDIYFVIAGDGKTAYYSSARAEGYGEKDIYIIQIDTAYVEKAEAVLSLTNSNALSILSASTVKLTETKAPDGVGITTFKGKVIDSKTKSPLEATILIKKVHTKENVHQFKTNPNGTFEITLAPGFDYAIDVEKEGYLFFSDNLDIPTSTKNQFFTEKIELKKPEAGEKIILKNVFFKIGSPYLNLDSRGELNILYDILNKFPNMKIEISGHTDNLGPADINQNLSEARAKAVFDYLVTKGINQERLKYIGFGSLKPITNNLTEDGRKLNRRTEFEIIEN